MSIRVTLVAEGIDAVIGPHLDDVAQVLVDEVYQGCAAGVLECREHDDDPRLADLRDSDGRVHGIWLYLRKPYSLADGSRYVSVSHHPHARHKHLLAHRDVCIRKGAQHQWQQDYYERAAQDAGHQACQEDASTVPGRVLDVKITGPAGVFAIEVQHTPQSVQKVRYRHAKDFAAGVTSVWSADRSNPDWAFRVPHVETNRLDHGHHPRGSWTITTGPRGVRMSRCEPSEFTRCPVPGSQRNFCGRWHPRWEPKPGLVVDDIAAKVPAGDLIVVDTQVKQGIVLAEPGDAQLWAEHSGDLIPAQRDREPNRDRYCHYTPQLAVRTPKHCVRCGNELFLRRPDRKLCARCDPQFYRLP